jgi:hypothetical protein
MAAACNRSQPPPPAAAIDAGAPAVATASAAPSAAVAFITFEGEIDVTAHEAKSKEPPVDLALQIKNGKIRGDIPDKLSRQGASPFGQGYFIIDPMAKKVMIVNDPRRQAFVFDLGKNADALKNLGGPPRPGAPPKVPPTISKTGRFDTLAGYKCEDWDITAEKRTATLCVADQDAPWLHLTGVEMPGEMHWVGELLDGRHLPLRFIGFDKDGTTEEGRVEVTKIEPKKLSVEDFEVPAGYQTMDLQKMMQGMAGMGHPPGMATIGAPHSSAASQHSCAVMRRLRIASG